MFNWNDDREENDFLSVSFGMVRGLVVFTHNGDLFIINNNLFNKDEALMGYRKTYLS